MARFMWTMRGEAKGNAQEVTRLDRIGSGHAIAASWQGAVKTTVYIKDGHRDCVRVEFVKWHGQGSNRLIYDGPIDGYGFEHGKAEAFAKSGG